MKSKYLLLVLFVIVLFSCKSKAEKDTVESQEELAVVTSEETVYDKLGGEEGVSSIVDDIIDVHLENEHIKQYFLPLKENPEYFNQFKQHVKDFLSAGTGGSVEYTGRDMSNAHKGLNLSEADFLHAIDDILLVLDKHQVDRNSRNEVLAILFSLKWMIIKQ